jgi:hypothetical protein
MAGMLRRGASATLQPTWNHVDLNGETDRLGGSRFPLVRVVYPLNGRLVASLAYGGYLDQTWGVRFTGEEVLGTDTVGTSDAVRSSGGIAQLRFGFSYRLTDRLALGVAGGMLSGGLDRSVNRTFEDTATFQSFESRLSWSYRAPQATVGARWDPAAGTRIGASLTVAGTLKAKAEDAAAEDREYGSSMKMTIGASTMLSPVLMATLGAARQKYPDLTSEPVTGPGGNSAGASTRQTWHYGGGLEYTGLHSATRVYPFRVGARYLQLPYAGAAETAPTEWSVALGSGFDFATDQGLPRALFDFSLERAQRSGLVSTELSEGLKESYWRMNISVSLFGQ